MGEHDVQVTFHIQVGRPGTGVSRARCRGRDRLTGHIGEGTGLVLTQQAESARTSQHEVH